MPLPTPSDASAAALRPAFRSLEELQFSNAAPTDYWPGFLQAALAITGGTESVILTRSRTAEESTIWKEVCCWPPASLFLQMLRMEKADLERLAVEADTEGSSTAPRRGWIAARLATGETQRATIVILRIPDGGDLTESAIRLRLVAAAPRLYQANRSLEQAKADMARFGVVIDLSILLDTAPRYVTATMTLCNELAARFQCDRVSLGWLDGGYVRLQTVSHTEKFEKRMSLATALEAAMDEAFDQDEEILFPAPDENTAVCRDHAALARAEGVGQALSLPIRLNGIPCGVLTLERGALPLFTTLEVQTLRLLCDRTARRLADLRRHGRWLGARLAADFGDEARKILGPEHTRAKVGVIAGAVLLAILAFGKMEYRVEAPFILKCDALAQIPAPFDGYLEEVRFRVGDAVTQGETLLMLDTRELLLQESAAVAERQRYQAEAQKAESEGNVAEMRIAQASADEAKARLDLATHHVAQASVLAPFSGYAVEGDLRERIAAPVKQGEVLVKVAKIDALLPEIAMQERDIHEITDGQHGLIAFASGPQESVPIEIERIEPVADVREKGNVFIVRGRFTGPAQTWWRPGMTGVAKIDVGQRNILWILLHRTVDFLRLKLWW